VNSSALEADPALASHRSTDRIGVVLAVATVVVGNAADERRERHWRPRPPGERKRTGEPGMVSLREDH
jgi:hypothetical protein